MAFHQTFFLRYCLRFTVFALVFGYVIRGYSFSFLPEFVGGNLSIGEMMVTGKTGLFIVPICLGYLLYDRFKSIEIVGVLFGSALLCSSFIIIKTTIPLMVPFWADPMLAGWDRALFGGVDGYAWSHQYAPYVSAGWAMMFYMPVWAVSMLLFPAFVVLVETDMARKQKYLAIYFYSWLVLGLVLATLMSSAGPIYYDRLLGAEVFAAMHESLAGIGFERTAAHMLQEGLWKAYEADGGQQLRGSDISAFPSMHVAMATLWGCYLAERSKWLAPVGFAYAAVILFLSVFTGWPYAVDGIFSAVAILAVCAAPAFLRLAKSAKQVLRGPKLEESTV